jgi:hypothetical protein
MWFPRCLWNTGNPEYGKSGQSRSSKPKIQLTFGLLRVGFALLFQADGPAGQGSFWLAWAGMAIVAF